MNHFYLNSLSCKYERDSFLCETKCYANTQYFNKSNYALSRKIYFNIWDLYFFFKFLANIFYHTQK